MIHLQCTTRLLKRLHMTPAPWQGEGSSRLGDWLANVLMVGHKPHAIFVNEESLLTLVLPLKETGTLVDRWRAEVVDLVRRLGAAENVVQAKARAIEEVVVTRTADRSSVGCLNEVARHCRILYEDRGELRPEHVWQLMENLSMSAIRYEQPAHVARLLLGAPIPERRWRPGDPYPART
jgi:hypothetical protein